MAKGLMDWTLFRIDRFKSPMFVLTQDVTALEREKESNLLGLVLRVDFTKLTMSELFRRKLSKMNHEVHS